MLQENKMIILVQNALRGGSYLRRVPGSPLGSTRERNEKKDLEVGSSSSQAGPRGGGQCARPERSSFIASRVGVTFQEPRVLLVG